MTKQQKTLLIVAALVIVATISAFGLASWRNRSENSRENLLALLPTDANAVVYVDAASLRQSSFLNALTSLAPQTARDPQYAKFVQDTGFDYERDLDRLAAAIDTRGTARRYFIIADGRFDAGKIIAYALRTGRKENHAGRDVYHVLASADVSETSFVFLDDHRIALANNANVGEELYAAEKAKDRAGWTERFDRLGGSPIFALIRQNAATGEALVEQAPGGFRSPQLATLLNRLDWISLAARPAGTHLRVVAEGEGATDDTTRQLSEFLSGALLLAQAGLSDPKLRAQMPDSSRSAILDLLKSADVSRVDRGTSKSVRVVFEVTPELLALAASTPVGRTSSAPETSAETTKQKASSSRQKAAHQ